MSKQSTFVIVGHAQAVLAICVSCAVAATVAVRAVGQRMLGAEPDGIDLWPTPGVIAPAATSDESVGPSPGF